MGFILDTGSQLNIMNTADAAKNGKHTEDLPDIELHIKGVTGKMMANWKRFRVHLKLERTGITHLKEIYLSPEVRDNLLSYETLKRLGHVNDNHFRQPTNREGPAQPIKKATRIYILKSEETTIYDTKGMKYSCLYTKRRGDGRKD